MVSAPAPRSLVEVRLLDGPNLYFPRPAAKLTLDLSELIDLSDTAARDLGTELGLGKPLQYGCSLISSGGSLAQAVRPGSRCGPGPDSR